MIGISNGVSHRFTEDGQRQFGYISLFLSEVGHVRNALALDVYAIVVNPDDKDAPCELAGMTLRRVRGSQHRIHAGLAAIGDGAAAQAS